MYKKNGCERYPDFKLYKMIARTVHNHTPNAVLENKYFERYSVNLMRSVSCFMVFTEALDILVTHGFQNHCASIILQENVDLFYFFYFLLSFVFIY